MNAKTCLIGLLGMAVIGCAILAPHENNETSAGRMAAVAVPVSRPSTAESQQILALQQERQQLLATLSDFHERVRDLESKLADRQGESIAKSYDELLAIKEAELAATVADVDATKRRASDLELQLMRRDNEARTLRKAAAERDSLATQLQTAAVALNHTKERMAGIEKQLAQKEQDLRTQSIEKQRLSAESAGYAADLKLARQRITALEQQAAEKEQQIHLLKRTASDRDQLASQLSAANMHLAQAKQQVSQLERQLAAKGQEMATLRSLVSEQEKLLNDLTSRKALTDQPPTTKEHLPSGPGSQTAAFNQSIIPKDGAASGSASSQQQKPSKPGDHQRAKLDQTKDELVKAFQADMARGSMTIKQDGNQLSVSLSSSLLFPAGDAALNPDGIVILQRIGQVLAQASDRAIQVTGHTDNQAVSKELRRTYPDNRALSWARADSARRALISGGAPPDHIRAIGLADKKPVASNTTEVGRQKNRRIEIIVTQFSTPSRTVTPAGAGTKRPSMAALSIPNRSGLR